MGLLHYYYYLASPALKSGRSNLIIPASVPWASSLRRTLVRPVILLSILCSFLLQSKTTIAQQSNTSFFSADNQNIQYIGRIDFTNPKLPRFWQPGVYINVKFSGSYCEVILNDEVLWGKNHNYLEIVVDGVAKRIQTKTAHDTIVVAEGLSAGSHTLTICKNTEANIGYLELVGIRCKALLKPGVKPKRKIEFIGNSITCGASSDMSAIPCGKGVWQDQHNAYMAYGPVTARTLQASYHLSSVSGIGLMHSCCNLDIVMPAVFDKISMRSNAIPWDFKKYQPDIVTVCLGQNDGIQDSTAFCDNYITFLRQLRKYYKKAAFLLLSSPMADAGLRTFQQKTLLAIKAKFEAEGDKKVAMYFFKKQYIAGCDYHPSVEEHTEIANELTPVIKQIMRW
jgi:lysophospholipase L1-like esterase